MDEPLRLIQVEYAAPMISTSIPSRERARAGRKVLELRVTAAVTGSTASIAFWLSLVIARAAGRDAPDADQR
jgi:hypothetical protein